MAERVADMTAADLHLQLRNSGQPQAALPQYRFARDNGWHCGHWHKTLGQAAECIELKLWKP